MSEPVCCRLCAGGRRIRTIGPSCKKRVVLVETRRLLKGADDRDPPKLQPFSRGSGSSNPSPSSGESGKIHARSGAWRPSLQDHDEIFFNAARLDRSIALRTADYFALAKPRLERICSERHLPRTCRSRHGIDLMVCGHRRNRCLADFRSAPCALNPARRSAEVRGMRDFWPYSRIPAIKVSCYQPETREDLIE